MLASGPNFPPLISTDPEVAASSRPCRSMFPETSVPKMPDSAKFHAKWRPIGSHSVRVATYAAPSIPPASTAIERAPHRVASGLSRCAIPKTRPVETSAAHVPNHCSTWRKSTPRKRSSSVTAAGARKPKSHTASPTEPQPATW